MEWISLNFFKCLSSLFSSSCASNPTRRRMEVALDQQRVFAVTEAQNLESAPQHCDTTNNNGLHCWPTGADTVWLQSDSTEHCALWGGPDTHMHNVSNHDAGTEAATIFSKTSTHVALKLVRIVVPMAGRGRTYGPGRLFLHLLLYCRPSFFADRGEWLPAPTSCLTSFATMTQLL
ncbi:hypothetical protein CC80DRAFT_56592 [Byssothecium circinans]|uniref:Uncharacterized protein n=1 Tax=Byssothecium circinans TaxID=147558 RepID=A0A6A5U7U9_9PLEO|nr:hypothetical protein CC80DRAFT_56592 [Byssothecium circinans]